MWPIKFKGRGFKMNWNVGLNVSDFSELGEIARILLLVAVPLVIIQVGLVLAAVISLTRKPNVLPTSDKVMWVLIVIFVNIIGPIVYFAVGSNMLEEKAARLMEHKDLDEARDAEWSFTRQDEGNENK